MLRLPSYSSSKKTTLVTDTHTHTHTHTQTDYSTLAMRPRTARLNIKFNTLTNYTTLYHTYKLLHCKRHILLTSNYSNINLEINKNNRVNKMIILNLIYLQIILNYITLTDYYIVKDTLS